jgi:glycosyltransferase involved in cell wall biosynthesis
MSLIGHNKITTVIPLYFDNGLPFEKFQKCIESVCLQTLKPTEIIISDDSSKVNLSKEINEFMSKFSIPYRYFIFPEATGIGSNSNNGLNKVTTEFVHILHADDELANSLVYESVFFKLAKEDKDWAMAGSLIEDRKHFPQHSDLLILGENSLGGPSAMFAKSEAYLFYDPVFHMMVDVEQYLRIYSKFGAPVLILEPLIVCGVGEWQVQKHISKSEVFFELNLLKKKYPLIWNEMRLSSTLSLNQKIDVLKIEKIDNHASRFSNSIKILFLLALSFKIKMLFRFKRIFSRETIN